MEKDYKQLLDDLRAGKIEHLPLTRDEFFVFRDVWKLFPDKADFRGIASLNGAVDFVYDPDANPVNQKVDEEER